MRIGYAVINGDGLVGRTVDAGHSVARVLLLNDLNSRIPVLVGPAGVRGLASGDNSAELQLDFLPEGPRSTRMMRFTPPAATVFCHGACGSASLRALPAPTRSGPTRS
nr:rod shape-determining protein MreC [Methyloceanibacter marginalis]